MKRWRGPHVGLLPAIAIALGACACGRSTPTSRDAPMDGAPLDTMPAPDSGPKPLALDFSATGCAAFDLDTARCDGNAPLTLTFTPVASEELIRFLWDFGDGSGPSSERSPTHTYTLPNRYAVTLVAGGTGGGTVSRSHSAYVNVTGAPIGAWCDVDQQCTDGLTCVCGSANPCRPVLARGICTRRCNASAGDVACVSGTTCADLAFSPAVTAPPTAPTAPAWRQALCLPVCADDTPCAPGFRCRDLLAVPPDRSWLRACFVTYPLGIGERCGDAMGRPVDADCASGLCSALGAFGRCAADCAQTICPGGTACAHLGDGRNLCLLACTGTSSCSNDPLLDCESPGSTGSLGFTVDGSSRTPTTTYCAPKRCATSADCGPTGGCPTGGGHCELLVPLAPFSAASSSVLPK